MSPHSWTDVNTQALNCLPLETERPKDGFWKREDQVERGANIFFQSLKGVHKHTVYIFICLVLPTDYTSHTLQNCIVIHKRSQDTHSVLCFHDLFMMDAEACGHCGQCQQSAVG